jgi:hypothetical protein
MPYCLVAVNPAETVEHFERVNEHLRTIGPLPPEGQRLMIAGPSDSGWHNISVWDSLEAQQRFFEERLKPAIEYAGCPIGEARMKVFEIHTLLAGDLVGAPQPA